ncbi:ribosomal protein L4 domain-containing protein [Schizophyllum amplum]|uniref:Large ribosomal subunit protein uL4m n=1 Tax=Schizophyllum amplum TaxID=97359 RepID=A0A550C5Z8_9AGAR|nr:ribosomal protein L4 domain-containing protein [Auriculariopsis ampla]
MLRGAFKRGIPTRVSRPTATVKSTVAALPVAQPVCVQLTPPLHKTVEDAQKPSRNELAVLNPTVFNHPIRRDILHLCVIHYRDGLRQGSANTKNRAEVRGSTRKIMRQKGTGHARVGDAQSPIRRGGGVVFGPKPRDFSTKLPRKVIEMGMRIALSSKFRERNLGVMRDLEWPEGKTRTLADRIATLGLRKTLFVTGHEHLPETLDRAFRNIPMVKLISASELNVYEALKWPRMVLDFEAVKYFEDTLKKDTPVAKIPLVSLESEVQLPPTPPTAEPAPTL